MARLDLKVDFSHIGSAIKKNIDNELKAIGKGLAREYSARVKNLIKEHAIKFKEKEKSLWNALGKAEEPQPGAFGEITGRLKKGTGYVITLNGVRISSSNTILGAPVTRRMRFKGKEFSPHKKQNNQYVRNFAVGIAIFTNVPYADFVNNPERKKLKNDSFYKEVYRKAGTLYAGTGWFDIYATLLTNMFYNEFLYTINTTKKENHATRSKFLTDSRLKHSINGNLMQTATARNVTNSIFNTVAGKNKYGVIDFPHRYVKGSNGKKGTTKRFAKPLVVKKLNLNLDYNNIEEWLLS